MNQQVLHLIGQGKVAEAIQLLLTDKTILRNKSLKKEIIQLAGRHARTLHKQRLNIIDSADSNIELEKITKAIIDICDRSSINAEISQVSLPKKRFSIYAVGVTVILALLGVIAYLFVANTTSEPSRQIATGVANTTYSADTFLLKYYSNEIEAHPDIEKELLRSKKFKLFIIKGSKLFREDDGLLFLNQYNEESFHPYHEFKVLLLDFPKMTKDQYDKFRENVSASWTSIAEDTKKQNNTMHIIKSFNPVYNIKVRMYNPSDFQYFKIFIFDDYCFFTVYSKVGQKLHQKHRFIRVERKDPIYEALESIFDINWQKARS